MLASAASWQGDVLREHRGRIERNFWPRVIESVGGCWEWTGSRSKAGYGYFSLNVDGRTRSFLVHRLTVMLLGRDPGETLDHLCRNRACCNPDHLESVSLDENRRRGDLRWRSRLTQCKRGHPFDESNTLVNAKGSRVCRECHRDAQRRHVQRKGGQ